MTPFRAVPRYGKSWRKYLTTFFRIAVSGICAGQIVLMEDFELPKPHRKSDDDVTTSNTAARKHARETNIVQLKLEREARQRLSIGDPGPCGFDWIELKPTDTIN
jgi:hypothetical protein